MEKKDTFQDVKALTIRLTKAESVTDSAGEKAFPGFLHSILSEIPYFKANPGNIVLRKIENDPKDRSNLFALVEGSGNTCVLLTGHYDVVQTSIYGPLEPWAFDPEVLAEKIVGRPLGPGSEEEALRALRNDLASGEFLPGRGVLDMKSGLAAGISVLSGFSRKEERRGNLLFFAVADEEGCSRGMRAAAACLPKFLESRGLRPRLVINLDAAVDQGSGEQGRAVFTGSVGKALPFAYFIGRCPHAGAPFDGINPALMASEFAREIECNPEALPEKRGAAEAGGVQGGAEVAPGSSSEPGEAPSPPTILYFREAREGYDVTTPQAFFCALNVLTHTMSPEVIVESLMEMARGAINRSLAILRKRASTFVRPVPGRFSIPEAAPSVVGFEEFARRAELASPGILESSRDLAAARHPDDRVRQSLVVLQALLPFAGIEGPAAVIGFAPPYYPRAEFDQEKNAGFMNILRGVIADFSKETGESLRLRPYFPGISDMSFLSFSDSPAQRGYVKNMSPVPDPTPGPTETGLAPIGCPVINLGPWGREYHQLGERVHMEYSFKRMPVLLSKLLTAVLGTEE